MEKMKRLLSAFLALVLVLGMVPGVPMTAGAEELETQPETEAAEVIETTAAVVETTAAETTAAAETEAAETIPAETQAEQTVPAETAPAETEAEETVPQETVAAETVPEETVEELEAAEEAADAYEEVLPVEEVKVMVSDDRTFLGDWVKVTAVVSPENVGDYALTWNFGGAEELPLEYQPENYPNEVLITSNAPMKAEIAVECRYTPVDEEEEKSVVSEPVTVTFLKYGMQINLLGLPDDNRLDEEDPNYDTACIVQSGESIQLNAKYLTWFLENDEDQAGYDREYKVETLHTPDLTWSLADGDQEYATLMVDPADCTKVTLYAKTVTKEYTVTLTAVDRIVDNDTENAGIHSVTVTVYPQPYKIMLAEVSELQEDFMSWDADTNTLLVNLNSVNNEKVNLEQPVVLKAQLYPTTAPQKLTWETSDQIITLKDPDEDEKTTDEMHLYLTNYSDTSTITIASVDNPAVSTTITVKRVRVMDAGRLMFSQATQDVEYLIAGQSKTFTAIDSGDKEILGSNVVEWSLPNEEDQAYATITKAGKLTVKNIAAGKKITLRCSIIDHPQGAYIERSLPVYPKATKVEILPGTLPSDKYAPDFVCNGQTLYVNTVDDVAPFSLDFRVYPGEESGIGALQKVTWTSSNKAIASIHPDNNKIIWNGKNGTVTITATAADGSGQKATVKLNFCLQATGIEIILPGTDYVRTGSILPLDVKLTPDRVDAAAKKTSVTWKIEGCDRCGETAACAKISTSGVITPKTVYENHVLTVTATTKDGSLLTSDPVEITVKPKKDGSLILKSGDAYVTKTTQMVNVEDGISLEAYSLYDGVGEIGEDVTWKSSNKAIATVDEYGYVEVLKPGQVTITATATDGSKRTATVIVKGVRMTSYIEITVKNDQSSLASGKSMTLKAAPRYDDEFAATIRTVTWSLSKEDQQYATITSAGRLTAVKNYVGKPVDITVVAKANDGSGVEESYTVTICAIAQGVQIDTSAFQRKSTTYLFQLGSVPEYLGLSAKVYPETASPDVTWTSSSKAIAEVDKETGDLEIKKAGTVTITATANDGSAKKASFKLKIVRTANGISFTNVNVCADGSMVIAGGKTLTPKVTLWDADGNKLTGRSLKWRIDDYEGDDDNGLAYVKSFSASNGAMVTKKVSEMKSVLVTVWTVEELDTMEKLEHSFRVDIWPATSAVKIFRNDVEVTTNLYVKVGEQLDLDAISYTADPNAKAAQVWDWSCPNVKNPVATVDEDGVVTGWKAGTVTITVTAKDGTGKKDTVKIIVQE